MKKILNSNEVRLYVLFLITFAIAASSILYELLLGQTLSAFLGNTIRAYSITIGLYMFSMGLGAFLTEGRLTRNPLKTLLWVEILLSIIGGATIVLAHLSHAVMASTLLFSGSLYLLIIIIGILTGMEIPLLFKLASKYGKKLENSILGVNYVGAFAGSVLFAFFFYPIVGLTATAFIVALVNAVAGIMLFTQFKYHDVDTSLYTQIIILIIIAISMILLIESAPDINERLINLYIS